MAQDYRIAIAIAKHNHKKKTEAGKQNAPNNSWGKNDYEKWMAKQLKKDK
jgi:hypothetical protein